MSISYEGIGAWCATFAAGTGAEEGKVVKVSANGTVSKCAANDGFCGVVAAMGRDGSAALCAYRTAARPRRRSAGICSRRTETEA